MHKRKNYITFDGKVVRGSGNDSPRNAVHLMSAMVIESSLILYQHEVSAKTIGIQVMQAMLRQLSVKGR
jgi:hypothetical protein